MTRAIALSLLTVVGVALPGSAAADPVAFKLLPNYSRATFKSDAPLETFVGNTAAEGVAGTLTVDPAKPQTASGVIKVDMTLVRTGIDKRDADMRGKNYLDTEVEANRWVSFEIKGVEVAGPLEPGRAIPAKVRAKFATTFTDHGLQIPQILIFKVANDIQLETDLTFARQ